MFAVEKCKCHEIHTNFIVILSCDDKNKIEIDFYRKQSLPSWCGLAVATVLPVAPVNDSEIGWASPGIWT